MTPERAAELERLEGEQCRRSLKVFVQCAWRIIEPGQELKWNWHLDALCRVLTDVTNGKRRKVLINVPPGTMKSLLVSVLWPAWEWTRKPERRYLCASYVADLATRDTMKMRDIITSPWYQYLFGVKLRGDQAVKTWFMNTSSGWRIATSTDGKGTGEHPDVIIIDDPHSAKQAKSDVERKAAVDWFDQTLSTRGVGRGVSIVVIMQRLHEDDLTGHLLALGGWDHIMYPMRFEPDRADVTDPRKIEGELLWPELFPEEKVRDLERDLNQYGTAGQLQQRPAPLGGGLFKRSSFKMVNASDVPKKGTQTRAWDVAATEGAGCYTVGLKMRDAGESSVPRFFIEDIDRGQWGPHDVDRRIASCALLDGRSCRIREEQEGGSAGKTVVAARARMLAGFDYRPMAPTGDKEVRANPLRSAVESGNVAVVRAPWNEAFFRELEAFPNGTYLDQCDAAAHAFNDLTTGARPLRIGKLRWG